MKYLYSFLLSILFLSFSCNRVKTNPETLNKVDSLQVDSDRILTNIGETLIPNAKQAVGKWEEYKNVDEFILKYYNISKMEALDGATELTDLVKIMKDSVRVEKLKVLNVKARINVLENETLRLSDMSTISSITDKEVREEVENILEVYSALNSKINTIYKTDDIQNSLDVDTEEPVKIGKDVVKIRPRTLKGKKKYKK